MLVLGTIGAVLQIICLFSAPFADVLGHSAGLFLRFVLAQLSSLVPFSLMELLFLSIPIICAVAIYLSLKSAKKGNIYLIRTISGILSIAAAVFFCFSVGFAPGYRGVPLADKAGLEQRDVSAAELYEVTLTVIEKLNPLSEQIPSLRDGSTALPMTTDELSTELSICYDRLREKYSFADSFPSRIKPLVISPLMTYTHLSGIYSFFTGEANLNTNYPDFVNAFTAAHEMAHQRGVSREDEANFTAFLVMLESDSDYIRYSAYLNMYQYLSGALYSADYDLWYDAQKRLSDTVCYELSAYSDFFDKYRDSTASKVADTLNNAYLESQGTEGTKSYGLVVDLAVAYYLNDNIHHNGID